MDKDVDATDTSSIKEIALYSSSIYLTGSTVVLGDPYAFVRKYDTTGNVVWTKIFRPESGYVTGNSIVADSSGIYVAGKVENGLFPNQTIPPATGLMDAFIRKFDLNGNHIWTRQFSDSDGLVESDALAADANSVYFAGTVGGEREPYLARFAKNGTIVWEKIFDYGTRGVHGYDVAVAGGIVYLASGGVYPAAVITALDTNGNVKWSSGFMMDEADQGRAIVADSSGAFIAAHPRTASTLVPIA